MTIKITPAAQLLRQEIIARKMATAEQLDGELSIAFMNNCSSKVNQYLALARPEDVEFAYNRPARIEASKEQAKKNRARRWWNPTSEPEQLQRVQEAGSIGEQFQTLFPQMANIEENRIQIISYLKSKGGIFSLDNVINAYQTLCSQGLIWVTPENCGLDGSEMIRGKLLLSHPQFHKILEPVVRKTDKQIEAEMTSDQYRAAHPEAFVKSAPYMVQKDWENNFNSFKSKFKEYVFDDAAEDLIIEYFNQHPELLKFSYNSFCAAFEGIGRDNFTLRKDYIAPTMPIRQITLEPSPTVKRVDIEKLLALPADEFQRVVNGTPGLRELLDGEQS